VTSSAVPCIRCSHRASTCRCIPRDEVEQKIWGRSHGQCEITILTGCRRRATDLHHRQAQGRVDTVANLVHLCNEDHLHRVHAFPEWAREVGLIIPRSANLPVVEWKFGVTMPRHPMLGG